MAVVTGANSGIGFAITAALARRGATIVMACRDPRRAQQAAELLRQDCPAASLAQVTVDLADLRSVREAAETIRTQFPSIDLLIANAGVSMPPEQLSKDGFELQFAVNHLGHFALTGLLLDRLIHVEGSRVVNVTSVTHWLARTDFERLGRRRRARFGGYADSKLATAMFAFALDHRLQRAGKRTRALAAHPGSARTEIARHIRPIERALAPLAPILQQSAAAGALPVIRAATDPSATGCRLYGPSGLLQWRGRPVVVRAAARAHDPDLQARLWAFSERATGVSFPRS